MTQATGSSSSFGDFMHEAELGSLMFCPTITRRVRVDRRPGFRGVLKAIGRKQIVDSLAVRSVPRGQGKEAVVEFFHVGRPISNEELSQEYQKHGLIPDPWAQSQVNLDDPSFADRFSNGSHWRARDGQWCYLAFTKTRGERVVALRWKGGEWPSSWWFAGVRPDQRSFVDKVKEWWSSFSIFHR